MPRNKINVESKRWQPLFDAILGCVKHMPTILANDKNDGGYKMTLYGKLLEREKMVLQSKLE